jgi:hypothetical protein
VNRRLSIAICIERIEEVRDGNADEDIIKSSQAALTTLHLLDALGFKEVSLLEDVDEQ